MKLEKEYIHNSILDLLIYLVEILFHLRAVIIIAFLNSPTYLLKDFTSIILYFLTREVIRPLSPAHTFYYNIIKNKIPGWGKGLGEHIDLVDRRTAQVSGELMSMIIEYTRSLKLI